MNTRNDPKNARIRGKSGPDENGPETVVAHLPGASSTAPLNAPGGTMTEDQSTQDHIHSYGTGEDGDRWAVGDATRGPVVFHD